jgi:hypothetical protein
MLYRITAYNKEINISVIMDSTEKLKNLEDFERYMVQKGFKIIESGTDDTFLGGNIKPPINYPEYVILRACQYGEPQERSLNIDGITYRAIKVNQKIYVPDKKVKF